MTPEQLLCSRCGLSPDSAFHTFWECPCNNDIDSPYVADTQQFIETARIDKEHQCLWNRGILTSDLVTIPQIHQPQTTSNTTIKTFCGHVQSWSSGSYYGDGSGGKHHKHAKLRRCGSSVCSLTSEGVPAQVAYSRLPGPNQTVPRSEVFALIMLLSLADNGSVLTYYTDHLPLHQNFLKGQKFCRKSLNCDLYNNKSKLVGYHM